MRLAVVIPALDEADHLAALLPDLLAREPDAEVVVVDGGSRDATRAIVARSPRARLLEAPRGRARQMNAGAGAVGGDALLFLHADTRLPDGASAAITRALADPTVVGGRFDVRFDNPRRIYRMIAWFMNRRSRLTGISTGDQAIFVRRAVFEAMGGFADIRLMEDVDFTRRLKRRGAVAALALRVTTSARKWEREGPGRTILRMWALRLLYALGASPEVLHRWYYRQPRRTPP